MSSRRRGGRAAAPRVISPVDVGDGDWRVLTLAAAVALAAGLLYALTAARDIVLGDSAELVTVCATLGVAHPPGYPLLTLLGGLFAKLPVGGVPLRVNLVSVLASAGTIAFVFLIARRVTGNSLAAALAALLLAVQPLFWEWSLVIEAFALNGFLASATMYSLLRWDARPTDAGWFVFAALTAALGAANHHTIVVLAPVAFVVAWRHRRQLLSRPYAAAGAALAVVAGLSLYLYIPWAAARKPLISWGDVSSASDLVHHILRTSYGTLQLTSAPGADQTGAASDRLGVLLRSFPPLEGLLVGVGAIAAFRSARRFFWMCALTFALAGPAFAVVANLNVQLKGYAWVIDRFFVLPHVLLAPLTAPALVALDAFLTRWWGTRRRTLARAMVVLPVVAAIVTAVLTQYRALDQHANHLARSFAEDLLASLEPNAVLLASTDDVVLPVAYLQAVEARRPDVTLVMLGPLTRGEWYVRELRARDPNLAVPFDRYDAGSPATTIRALVDANPARVFALVGPPIDASLESAYWYLPHGLVLEIEPAARDVAIADVSAENDRLFRSYNIPSPDVSRRANFDPYVLLRYSTAARLVGAQYAAAQMNSEALAWFERAVALDPDDAAARIALNRAGGSGR